MSEEQGFFGRIASSFVGMAVGAVMVVGGLGLQFWNEGRAVKRAQDLNDGQKAVVMANAEKPDATLSGKLVHITGTATTKETLTDPLLGVSAVALTLEREVEMYQWREKSRKVGSGNDKRTEYSYEKVWDNSLINSSSFHTTGYSNPTSKPYPDQTWTAQEITIGGFRYPSSEAGRLRQESSVAISEQQLAKFNDTQKKQARLDGDALYIASSASSSPQSPQIGDVRIRLRANLPHVVSVMGNQGANFELSAWTAPSGRSLFEVRSGTMSAAQMFEAAKHDNTVLLWILRGVGVFVVWMGFMLLAGPITTLADYIPFLGGIVNAGIGLIAFLLAGSMSLFAISIGWIFYRPLVGGLLLAGGVGMLVLLARAGKRKPVAL